MNDYQKIMNYLNKLDGRKSDLEEDMGETSALNLSKADIKRRARSRAVDENLGGTGAHEKILKVTSKYGRSAMKEDLDGDDVYKQHGYLNREDYLRDLSAAYNVPYETVEALATTLGSNEDFDGLISQLEDLDDIDNEAYDEDDWDDDDADYIGDDEYVDDYAKWF